MMAIIKHQAMLLRRTMLLNAGALLATTGCAFNDSTARNFVEPDWQEYFQQIGENGAVLVDTRQRRLSVWTANAQQYREYPIGIARSEELVRRGKTRVVRKKSDPAWAPTPSMLRANPSLPRFVPAGPDNPLGEYALYLSWQYFAIHGTNDPASVGRRTTAGCIRLLPGHILWLYENVGVGAPVSII